MSDYSTQERAAVTLFSSGLLSKWGFHDGDEPPEVERAVWEGSVSDLRTGLSMGLWHGVLCGLVRDYLVPALDQQVEVVVIDTIHNPIRAERVDGVDVRDWWYDPERWDGVLTPESVAVPLAEVLDRLRTARG